MSPTSSHEPSPRSQADVAPPGRQPGASDQRGERAAAHPEATKGFVLNVTAALPRGVGDGATGRSLRIDPPLGVAAEVVPEAALEPDVVRETETLAAVGDNDDAPAVSWPAAASWPVQRSANARQKRRRIQAANAERVATAAPQTSGTPRRWSAWSLSCVVHGVMAAALSLVTIAQLQPREEMDLFMAPDEVETLDDLQLAERELNPTEAGDSLAGLLNETSAAVIDPGTPSLGAEAGAGLVGDLTDEMALVGGGGGGADGPFGGLGGAGGLFGDGTGGSADYGTGLGGAATAQFFGTKIEGRRIVFVLDNSGSMQQGRLEAVIAELQRCVESLAAEQEFYVVFYSDMAYPLFYPNPADDYIRPTPRNKERLARWLDTVELCLGDAVVDALAGAISVEPDTVFLLSDGRIQGEKKMAFLLEAGGGEFPIHTVGVGLGAGAVASRENLQQVAAANGGDFREAAVPAEMRELAREKPRPYHNRGPGPIWGRSVKVWGGR